MEEMEAITDHRAIHYVYICDIISIREGGFCGTKSNCACTVCQAVAHFKRELSCFLLLCVDSRLSFGSYAGLLDCLRVLE